MEMINEKIQNLEKFLNFSDNCQLFLIIQTFFGPFQKKNLDYQDFFFY